MVSYREVYLPDEKSSICNGILRALPNWFGVEASIIDYTKMIRDMPFYVAESEGAPIGFVVLKTHNIYTAELYVMGVLSQYHRQGAGKQLVRWCEEYCKNNRHEYLTVKTLDESRESKNYAKTRMFYQAMGFRPLEVFPLFWDEDNPCLFMAKFIS